MVNSGYHKVQYDFKTDGTYTAHGESQFSSNDFSITDENGTYTLKNDQLIISPSGGKIVKVDANRNIKKTETLNLSKRTYTWKTEYFSGINETDLVLSGVGENIIDGGFASNAQFPKSFLYSREFMPEWRFK